MRSSSTRSSAAVNVMAIARSSWRECIVATSVSPGIVTTPTERTIVRVPPAFAIATAASAQTPPVETASAVHGPINS